MAKKVCVFKEFGRYAANDLKELRPVSVRPRVPVAATFFSRRFM